MNLTYLDKVMANPNGVVRVMFNPPGGRAPVIVRGFLAGDIRIAGKADFNSSDQSSGMNTLNRWGEGLLSTYNSVARGTGLQLPGVGQFQMKSMIGSTVSWQGSDNFFLSIPMMFIAVNKGDDVRKNVADLLWMVYPSVGGGFPITKVTAPLGYKKGVRDDPESRVGVWIGKWFRSTRIFVAMNVSFSNSQETTLDGLPLFSSGEIMLQAARVVDADEIRSWMLV